MKISLKIFLGYFVIVGLAAFFVLNVFVDEVKPGVRQAMEESLVDTASVLAALAAQDFKAGQIQSGNFAQSLKYYQMQNNRASIWGIPKSGSDYRVYITDINGIVVFDSANLALGQDYSQWNDVYLTLRGKYGARSSPVIEGDKNGDTVMHVAAPIKDGNRIIGALTVAKPNRALLPFIERAQTKILRWGALLLALSVVIGVLFTWRFTRAIHRLRDYAVAVSQGKKTAQPTSRNDELDELAKAMHTMRTELDGKQYVQDYIHQLTHELKSPITAIQASSELLQGKMRAQDRQKFLSNIQTQTARLQQMIQNMLGLATMESQQKLAQASTVNVVELVQTQIKHLQDKVASRRIQLGLQADAKNIQIQGEAFLLAQAITNLLENALDFSPDDSSIEVHISSSEKAVNIRIRDHGTGIPDYALDKIFDKFYSLPRPDYALNAGQKSTGLGLNFVREVALLHGGKVQVQNHQDGGVIATLILPLH